MNLKQAQFIAEQIEAGKRSVDSLIPSDAEFVLLVTEDITSDVTKKKLYKHPAVIAQDQWLLSAEGVRCSTMILPSSWRLCCQSAHSSALWIPTGNTYCLDDRVKNRLKLAFMAGWNAAKKAKK